MKIENYRKSIDTIDAILQNNGIAEIKVEGKADNRKLVVVEVGRTLRSAEPITDGDITENE